MWRLAPSTEVWDMIDLTIHTGCDPNSGLWYAASGQAPYFCFEGSSEREAQQLAKAALAFYESLGIKAHNQPKRRPIIRLQNRVLASEIAA